MTLKRSLDSAESLVTMANSLMLLSGSSDDHHQIQSAGNTHHHHNRMFECKTCSRQFTSFQALGGHRASHKKPRLDSAESDSATHLPVSALSKSKIHKCSICGTVFAIGQALGGHMRRHRDANATTTKSSTTTTAPAPAPAPPSMYTPPPRAAVPVFKRSNSKRVLSLDLNLTPFENDFEFCIQNTDFPQNLKSPKTYHFI